MTFKCPKCNYSTRFHVEKAGSIYTLKCERTKACGWEIDLIEKL
jgi:transcription elongation factor Elf1